MIWIKFSLVICQKTELDNKACLVIDKNTLNVIWKAA